MSTLLLAYEIFISFVALILLVLAARPKSKRDYETSKGFMPRTLVIIPCRGRDIALTRNLKAAKSQRYRNYDVVAVVDSADDEAVAHIRAAHMRFIVSDIQCRGCSGKVRAIVSALERFRNYDAYVILDSDVLAGKDWLSCVVAPLADRHIGISTSFPVFKPVGGFWSHVKFTWGFVGASLMESASTRFGWGGTLAFRTDLLSKADILEFRGSVSDDIALTRIAKRKGLGIAYVPEARPVVETDEGFAAFVEWSTRQTAFSLAGDGRLFYYGVVFYSASVLCLLSGVALAVAVGPIFLLLLLPTFAAMAKMYMRSGSAAAVCISPLINFVYLANLLRAKGMGSVTWRGRIYRVN
ncbi:MAG: glycosyltransferase family 2 protein [Candidatus Micrarchaeaceae archaeon]|jgi:cellulose synthase/poly-beta-1,6-N-acetylglucosamine synthase-like glycosyltransferase|nr:glycosyltransferase family 2 protein [Candidatus Micrarchaeota archaeon]